MLPMISHPFFGIMPFDLIILGVKRVDPVKVRDFRAAFASCSLGKTCRTYVPEQELRTGSYVVQFDE